MVFLSITTQSGVIPKQSSQIYANVTVTKSVINDMFNVKIQDSEIIEQSIVFVLFLLILSLSLYG